MLKPLVFYWRVFDKTIGFGVWKTVFEYYCPDRGAGRADRTVFVLVGNIKTVLWSGMDLLLKNKQKIKKKYEKRLQF